MKYVRIALVLLAALLGASGCPTQAQTTTVTATVQDPLGNPYAGGTVAAALQGPGGVILTSGGVPVRTSSGPFTLDSNGHFSIVLTDNNSVDQSGTVWFLTVCDNSLAWPGIPTVRVCFTSGPLTITGASMDVSTTLNAISLPLAGQNAHGSAFNNGSGPGYQDVGSIGVPLPPPPGFIRLFNNNGTFGCINSNSINACPGGLGAFNGGSGPSFQDVGTIANPGSPSVNFIRLYADNASGFLTCLTSSGGNACPGAGGGAWSSLLAATQSTVLNNGGFATTFQQSGAVNWTWTNTQTATSGFNPSSVPLNLVYQYWNGASSATQTWQINAAPASGSGANPEEDLKIFAITGSTAQAFLYTSNLRLNIGYFDIGENGSSANPGAGFDRIWMNTSHQLNCTTSSGTSCSSVMPLQFPVNVFGATAGGIPYFSDSTHMAGTGTFTSGNFILAGNPPTAPFSVVIPQAGGTGLNAPAAHSLLVAEGASVFNLITSPSVNGYYVCGFNVTASAAVDPTCNLQGLPSRGITGPASTDTVAVGDDATVVAHVHAATGTVNETLPTATTLGIPFFTYIYCNNSPQTDTITPTTWAIQAGNAASASTLSVAPGSCYRIHPDPSSTTNWLAEIQGGSGGGGGVTTVSGDGALYTNSNSNGNVTLTLGSAGAHKFWGNNTGSSGTPAYVSLGLADLPAIPISSLAVAAGTNTIANANFNQTWQWSLTSTTDAFDVAESAASTGTGYLFSSGTLATSTAIPFRTFLTGGAAGTFGQNIGFETDNVTAATSSQAQPAPLFQDCGFSWSGAGANTKDCLTQQLTFNANTTNPGWTYTFGHSGSTGNGTIDFTAAAFFKAGGFNLNGAILTNATGSNTISIQPLSSTAATGKVNVEGGDVSGGNSASAAGGIFGRGGNDASTSTTSSAGGYEFIPGAATGATQGIQGIGFIGSVYIKGTTVTQWNLQCFSASMTIADCGASPGNWLGVAEKVNTNTVQLASTNQVTVNASAAVTLGHTVCAGATAGQVTDSGGTTACALGSQVGVVAAVAGTFVYPDGTSVTLSTTLPLVQLARD